MCHTGFKILYLNVISLLVSYVLVFFKQTIELQYSAYLLNFLCICIAGGASGSRAAVHKGSKYVRHC